MPSELLSENVDAIRAGAENLQAHIDIIRQFGLPIVVAINQFPSDTDSELDELRRIASEGGALAVEVTDAFRRGSEGATNLARSVIKACEQPNEFHYLYPLDMPTEEKIETIATMIYGAEGVDFQPAARRQLRQLQELGFGGLPVCIAKTQYSLSHDPLLLGRPRGFRVPVREVRWHREPDSFTPLPAKSIPCQVCHPNRQQLALMSIRSGPSLESVRFFDAKDSGQRRSRANRNRTDARIA